MNTVITDIKDLIEASSHWEFGKDLFGGKEPASPANCLTLFDAPDRGRFLMQGVEENTPERGYDYLAIQARIRHQNYDKGMFLAWELIGILHGTGNQVINGTLYTVIESLDSPHLLEWDDNDRAKIVCNFAIQRTPFSN